MALLQPLPWHAPICQQLQAQVRADRLAHAYLIRGAEGVGKQHLSTALAAWLLCERSGEAPCGVCRSCQLLSAGTHPDLLQVLPEAKGKQIKIEQIRRLIDFSAKTAQMDGRRVVVLGPAEAMNPNSANALLKVLEEPGDNTVLLLFSHQVGDLLPTLRSRCQILSQSLPEETQALAWLAQAFSGVENDQRALALRLSGERPLLAGEYLESGALEWRARVLQGLGQVTKGQLAPVAVAARWKDVDPVTLLEWMVRWLADMVRFSACGDETVLGPEDSRAMLKYVAQKAGAPQLLNFYQQLIDWLRVQRSQGSLNKALLLETVLIQWLHLTMSASS